MSWPSIQEYEFAVQNFGRFALAPQFKGGSPVRSKSGMLAGFSGGYSVVYPVRVGTKTLALRCWIKDPGSVEQRYNVTSTYLKSNPCQYFVDFGYVDEGILVDDVKRSISYMEWIEGVTLSKFLDENIQNSSLIREVADKFRDMVTELHQKKISHGDLQDGNIMVCRTSSAVELKLVDYDSLFVPGLQSNPFIQDELPGVIDYQHPNRTNQSDEKSDYFSELVIYLSLCAYAEQSSLWNKDQEKRLLFTAKDFEDFRINPSGSTLYRTLNELSPHIQILTDKLVEFCREKDATRLLPLEKVLPPTPSAQYDLYQFFGADSVQPTSPLPQAPKGTPAELEQFFNIQPVSAPSQQPITVLPVPVSRPSVWQRIAPAAIGSVALLLLIAVIFATAKVTHVAVYSTSGWQATSIILNKSSLLYVDYLSGQWTVDVSLLEMVGSEGYPANIDAQIWDPSQCKLLQDAPYGALLGRVGNGPIFQVGRSKLIWTSTEGELFLSINDAYQCSADNQGEIAVRVIAK